MNFDLKSAAMVGGIGMIGALWSNIKTAFAYLASIFIVEVEFQLYETGEAFMVYAWKHFKYVPLGERSFDIWSRFVKRNNRHTAVAHEVTGSKMVFFKGFKPIFVKKDKDSNSGRTKSQTKITFIRGTFDARKLIALVAAEYDKESMNVTKKVTQFEVKKFYGKTSTLNASDDNPYTKNGGSATSNRPVGYGLEELGVPTSANPFENLAYNAEVMGFKDEIIKWKNSKEWYEKKGLAWRMGAGLYGMPGTGKTSFIRAIAQEIDVPVHIYDLTTMSNEELTRFWGQSLSVAPAIVLFEDIDRIFNQEKKVVGIKDKAPLTMDCLLNLICGIEPSNGILVFVTANDMTKIDPALGVLDENGKPSRPGRLDRVVIFGPLSEESRRRVAKRILADAPDLIEQAIKEGIGESGAQFEHRCAIMAIESYWGKPKMYTNEDVVFIANPNVPLVEEAQGIEVSKEGRIDDVVEESSSTSPSKPITMSAKEYVEKRRKSIDANGGDGRELAELTSALKSKGYEV